jgi:hypothetical protein
MAVSPSTEQHAPAADIGLYHELCARCKRFGQALWESFTNGRNPLEAVKDVGFEVHLIRTSDSRFWIDFGPWEELVPDRCHQCAIQKAMSGIVASERDQPAAGFGCMVYIDISAVPFTVCFAPEGNYGTAGYLELSSYNCEF